MKYVFYHITDSHFYSKKNFSCDPWSLPQFEGQISFRESEEILDEALQIILNDEETSTVIFTGDMTDHGDEYSHREMLLKLKAFTEKGGEPFVVTDSHDYPWFEIFRIDENGKKAPKEHMSREDVVPMYYPFGRDKALEVYDGDDTTYIAEIQPGLRYIAMGYDLTANEGKHDPKFSENLMNWVENQIKKAQNEGCYVICGTHWPVILPSPVYAVLGKGNFFVNGEECMKRLADLGVKLFFSGHTHIQCIKEITSENGNKLYSIQTSALVGYPPKMRKITIDTDNNTAKITTIDMDAPKLNLGMTFTEYTRKGFLGSLEEIPYNMEHDVEAFANTGGGITLPQDLIRKHPKIVMFLGKTLNNLTYGKMAKFSKKYHKMKPEEYMPVADEKVVPFVFDLVAGLFRGNQSYSPETVEYKITMGVVKKAEKIAKILRVKPEKYLCGFTLAQIVEPLLYNGGKDDDNRDLIL